MKIFLTLLLIMLSLSFVMAQETPFKKKYINHTELGALVGRVKYAQGGPDDRVESKVSITAQTFNGIQMSPRLGVGVTVGADWYKTALITPIAAGIRYDLPSRGTARFFALADAGYGFTWLHQDSDGFDTKGGLMINPGIGLRAGKPGASSVTISLTYKRQEAFVKKPAYYTQIKRDEDRVYNRIAIRLGISF
ncbi:hypothetical protein [Dyadobacter sp. LHD-138]|uniref:hypothetical protein n=1 Tax=Dyadobacter sp. LHD-138 TaxID=3071413 RepID=UPI0027E150C4|nr:hypothetical protein [Dyadobacter sp. LHD-138]MDQ6480400.1 hypothetical protein [Dyadobacter sp. LHD-138]